MVPDRPFRSDERSFGESHEVWIGTGQGRQDDLDSRYIPQLPLSPQKRDAVSGGMTSLDYS